MQRIMIVDDEPFVLSTLTAVLKRELADTAPRIEPFSDPTLALERLNEVSFDVVASDFRMPRMDGISFLKLVRTLQPRAVRLMLTAATETAAVVGAVNDAEVFRYIVKPWGPDLGNIVRAALRRYAETSETVQLADRMREKEGTLSAENAELRRLEADEPGITQVKWGADGSVILFDE